jgi:hypothetical protein
VQAEHNGKKNHIFLVIVEAPPTLAAGNGSASRGHNQKEFILFYVGAQHAF